MAADQSGLPVRGREYRLLCGLQQRDLPRQTRHSLLEWRRYQVVVAGWAGPCVRAVGLSCDVPAGVVFGVVVALAEGRDVVAAGHTARCPRVTVVEVA